MADELKEKIEKALDNNSVVLFKAPSDQYHAKCLELMKIITDMRPYGIYVTVNKPSSTLEKEFKKKDINSSKIFFIDGISEGAGMDTEREGSNRYFLKSPKNLTDLSIVISGAVKDMPSEKKFLYLDSLSTLTVYNRGNIVSKFAHQLSNKLRKWEISGVFMSVQSELDEKVMAALSQFTDYTIEL